MKTKVAFLLEAVAKQNIEQGNKLIALEIVCSVMMAHIASTSAEGVDILRDIQAHLEGVSQGVADGLSSPGRDPSVGSKIISSSIERIGRHAEEAFMLASAKRYSAQFEAEL